MRLGSSLASRSIYRPLPSLQTTGTQPPARQRSLVDRILDRVHPGGEELTELLKARTLEGAQEMASRSRTSPRESNRVGPSEPVKVPASTGRTST